MSEEVEPLNPNTQQAISLPPALVEAVQENPELLTELTRGQLAVVQDRMVQKVLGDPAASVAMLTAVHKALSDNAQLKPQAGAVGGGGAQVVINFIRAPGKETVTIENATGKPVLDAPN
jgi:hypothetical protein